MLDIRYLMFVIHLRVILCVYRIHTLVFVIINKFIKNNFKNDTQRSHNYVSQFYLI